MPKTSSTNPTVGSCLSLRKANLIVGDCAPNGQNDFDQTLEEVGLITDDRRKAFRECVWEGVRDADCRIRRNQIPSTARTTLRKVRDAIMTKSQ